MTLLLLGCTLFGKDQPPDSKGEDSSGAQDSVAAEDLSWVDASALPAGADPCREPKLVWVLDVLDGDTAVVGRKDGFDSEKVRFIGIDTPEIAHGNDPAECWGPEAAERVKEMLEGHQVWLTFDVECTDKYDRTLAYLHRGPDEFVQRSIVKQGWAYDFPYYPNVSFEDELRGDESWARQQDLGLWADCN